MAERDQRSIVLALEAPGGPNSRRQCRRQQSRPRARRSSSGSGACPSFPDLVTVHAGEDIVESIRLYFEGCESIWSRYQTLTLKGHILSAQGQISNPIVKKQGSYILVEGIHTIGTLSGFYDVSFEGPVQSNDLMLSFYESNGQGSGGYVVGPLIAATDVQIMIHWLSSGEEN